MREDSYLHSSSQTWVLCLFNKNRSGCAMNKLLKFMLINKPLAYPPISICGLLESLVTPKTSGIKSPLKLKTQNNFSITLVTTGVEINCSWVHLYLVNICPTRNEEFSACVVFSEFWLLSECNSTLLSIFCTMPCIWFCSYILSPPVSFSISHKGKCTVKGRFAQPHKPVRFLFYKIHQKMNGCFSA